MLKKTGARHPPVTGVVVLGHVADLCSSFRSVRLCAEPEDRGIPGVRALEIQKDLERRAFSRAVRTDEHVYRAFGHSKIDLVECRLSAVALGEIRRFDGERWVERGHCSAPRCAATRPSRARPSSSAATSLSVAIS